MSASNFFGDWAMHTRFGFFFFPLGIQITMVLQFFVFFLKKLKEAFL